MKKLFSLFLALALVFSGAAMAQTLSVIATPSPHAEIVRLVEEDLAAAGYELDLIEVTDYVTENPAVAGGDVMINFFQHIPYLEGYNASVPEDEQLTLVIPTHFEPMGIYPGTKESLDDIAEGDSIAVPNDPTNLTRAFLLLADAGLISVPEGTGLDSIVTKEDIVGDLNPLNLEFYEANAELIPGLRSDVAFAVINGNNAALAELNPNTDAVYAETADSLAGQSYVNVFAVRPEDAEADFVKVLEECVYTQKVYDLIIERGFVPVFTPTDAE
ncbi:MAG TPA: methionine ABC transporter substrate-binding protein [Candidatus Pullichristensenella excrementigallinarum]|uniref:Methionine ABC transporter substrate-binding protein n=1 Tax=Candidatus Pullichristensenella excrementigallinarum TaxID=2840907 RepID=A0A9D1LA60_9FIRM|nr:methionine ABC transporter substrate-binding protein [Candidatus Pullichristensenella excrementigallinarum]